MGLSRRNWLYVFCLLSFVAVFNTLHFGLDDLTRGQTSVFVTRMIEEFTGAYTVLLLLPIVLYLVRRFPIGCDWRSFVTAHLCGLVVYTILHTTLLWGTRSALFLVLGMGHYDYGNMLWRYPMEAASDAIDYVLIFAIIVLFQSLDAAQRAKVTEAELEAKLSEAKLENLRLQLQPHFLFNTLNAISTVMYEDVAKADKMLAQVSDFMRLVLDSSGVQTVPLAEEVRIERMYVDIMKTRLERNLALDVEIDESAREMMIPFMLLQPLLENSIRHGLGSTRSSLDLRIDVRRENGSAIVRVSDNGIGYAPSGSWGIGLRNTTDRLAHLYGARASFRIEASPAGGTVATVVLPLTTKELT